MFKIIVGALVTTVFLAQFIFIHEIDATRQHSKSETAVSSDDGLEPRKRCITCPDAAVSSDDGLEDRETVLEAQIELLMQRIDNQQNKLARLYAECRRLKPSR
jgi:hypothetical protein